MLRFYLPSVFSCLIFCLACAQSADTDRQGVSSETEEPVTLKPATADSVAPKKATTKTSRLRTEVRERGVMGGTLNLSTIGNPKRLNPILSNESVSNRVLSIMFKTCFSFDYREQELRPALCEMVAQNEVGTEFIYTLRDGLKWSDGHPLTSADVAFSYKVLSDPALKTYSRDLFVQAKDRRGRHTLPVLEIIDERRFKIVLQEANQQFHLIASTMPIIPKHEWEEAYKAGDFVKLSSPKTIRLPIVGSGPFFLTSYEIDDELVLKRNQHYWKADQDGQQLPYLSGVRIHIHRDLMMSHVRFSESETHIHDVRAAEYSRLMRKRQQGKWQIQDLGPSHSTNYLMFNLDPVSRRAPKNETAYRRSWFRDVMFRRAISHAIDREGLIRNILWSRGQPLWSYNSPADRRWSTDKVKRYQFDLEEAERKLERAGFRKKGSKLMDKKGVHVEFSVLTNAENGQRVTMLQYMQKDLAKLGITMNVEPQPFNQLLNRLDGSRDFDAILLGWGADVPSDPMFSKNVLLSSGQDHLWQPSQRKPATSWEAKIDTLLAQNLASQHYETRKPLLDQILVILSEELPQIPLVVEYMAAAADIKVGNFEPYALDGGLYWNIDQLFLRTN